MADIRFIKEKETKNTVRFVEQPEPGTPPLIGTLYVQKWAAEKVQEILITIKFKK